MADTKRVAAVFTAGFITLNACFDQMHVSLVMVLRAAEPLTTLGIGVACFGTQVPLRRAAALLSIVAGCACSAVGPFSPTTAGLALAVICNVCFSLRGLLGKRLGARYGAGSLESLGRGRSSRRALLLPGALRCQHCRRCFSQHSAAATAPRCFRSPRQGCCVRKQFTGVWQCRR